VVRKVSWQIKVYATYLISRFLVSSRSRGNQKNCELTNNNIIL